MRRELVWVIIISISFGLIVAFGVWRINSSMNKPRTDGPQATPISQNPVTEFKITLNSPADNSVVTSTPVNVSGITKALTWIVVSGEAGDYILQSDENGTFAQDVDLTPGINQIKITALDPTGTQSLQKVLVIYSSAFQLKAATVSTPGSAATGDAAITTGDAAITTGDAAIKEAVAQKVAEAMSRPIAYLGVVTDITSTTIEIKTPESSIEQIAVSDSGITVVDTKGTGSKQVKLVDIAIGDFIVAMGYVNGNQVLNAQRILVTDPITEPKLDVSMAKVTDVSKKSITVTDVKNGGGSTLTPDKNTDIEIYFNGKTKAAKLSNILVGEIVISVTDASASPALLRSVFDIGTPS